ncbi:MAG TPA: histidine kinase, partial [Saprospiraceae bacterium]|nr:histidine kinase [Saprospiraceae bacterium]
CPSIHPSFSSIHPHHCIAGYQFAYLSPMPVKRYSNKEPLVFLYVVVPYILFMNLLIFGGCLVRTPLCMLKSFGISAIYFFIIYAIFGSVAVLIKNKYPGAGDLFRRISIMLPVFYAMNVGAIYGAFRFYDYTQWLECPTLHGMRWWTILYGCIMSTVITFINEGMANWEKWKNSLSETEKLNNAYQRSRLLGLKGQINPHFLFNCFNTLSGLIQENETEAERFLDEMIKVHRYLLRNDDDYLVTLGDEMKFANAYLNLTKARFGDAIHTDIQLPNDVLVRRIPPLSLQVILENIIYTNALSKKQPLHIEISSDEQDLKIIHSLHEKTIVQNLNLDEGLDNLITKYRLLNAADIKVSETSTQREIRLPLFEPVKATA